jgi:hypothetical protein
MKLTDAQFLAWPLVVLLLGGWIAYLIRTSLNRLVDRAKINYRGKGIEATTGAQQESASPQPSLRIADSFFDHTLLAIYRKEIAEAIEKSNLEGEAKQRELLDFSAAIWIISYFERSYLSIYGSQLAALRGLNSGGLEGLSVEQLRSFFDIAASLHAEFYTNISFEQWIGFLERSQLVTHLSNGNIGISINGRSFLKYLINQGYPLSKEY